MIESVGHALLQTVIDMIRNELRIRKDGDGACLARDIPGRKLDARQCDAALYGAITRVVTEELGDDGIPDKACKVSNHSVASYASALFAAMSRVKPLPFHHACYVFCTYSDPMEILAETIQIYYNEGKWPLVSHKEYMQKQREKTGLVWTDEKDQGTDLRSRFKLAQDENAKLEMEEDELDALTYSEDTSGESLLEEDQYEVEVPEEEDDVYGSYHYEHVAETEDEQTETDEEQKMEDRDVDEDSEFSDMSTTTDDEDYDQD